MNDLVFKLGVDVISTVFEQSCLLYLMSIEQVRAKNRRVVWFLFCVVSIVFFSYLDVNMYIKAVILFIQYVPLAYLVFNSKVTKLVMYYVVDSVLLLGVEVLGVQVWNFFNIPIYNDNLIYGAGNLTLNILAHAVYLFLICMIKPFLHTSLNASRLKEIILLPFLGISFIVTLLAVQSSLPIVHKSHGEYLFLISSVSLLITLIALIFFLNHYFKVLEKNQQERRKIYELKLTNEYYIKKLESQNKIRDIYHDLKNHFLLSERHEISLEIKGILEKYEEYYHTGNEFLDIVLADKISKAKSCNIKMELNVNFSDGNHIEVLDITTIFGNLLDNAIEAAQKVKEEKYIFFEASRKRELLTVSIKNSMNTVQANGSILETTKRNKNAHGLGIKNVRESLKKYGGALDIRVENNFFVASLMIPVYKSKSN